MIPARLWLPACALVASPAALASGDYVGVLRPAASAIAIPEPGFYWMPERAPASGFGAGMAAERFKLRLGYRYSRYFSVETGYADSGWTGVEMPLARATGFSMDTVGTLPLWTHAALYGRFGAWRSGGSTSLLAGADLGRRPSAGLRYGLGVKYDVTRRIGLQAEMERFSPLDRWGTREPDSDQVTLGVTWRF